MADPVLELLRKAEGKSVSGEKAARKLGISRTALWKRINILREKGYIINSEPGKGYKLIATPELDPDEIMTMVEGSLGKETVFIQKAVSTNDMAMRMAAEGAPHGTVVMADTQTGGKGRLGRRWHSPAGVNIYMSIVLRPKLEPAEATLLTILCAVSVVSAVREKTTAEPTIKWPNDIMAGEKKLGGILLEMRSEPDRILHAVAGIGLNVNAARFPRIIKDVATSILMLTGEKTRRGELVAAILDDMDRRLAGLESGGAFPLLAEWKRLSSTLGKRVNVSTVKGSIIGTAEDIDESGRLLLNVGRGKLVRVDSGDVTLLR